MAKVDGVKKGLIGWLLVIVMLLLFSNNLYGKTLLKKQVVILDIPRFGFADIRKEYPSLNWLMNNGAAGMMIASVSDPIHPSKVYYALNSGRNLKTIESYAGLIMDHNEKYQNLRAADLYQALSGYQPLPEGAVHLGLSRIWRLNKANAPAIGSLGEILHQNSLKTAVIGNADSDLVKRNGAAMLIDGAGRIDYSALGKVTLQEDPHFPFGYRSDCQSILKLWREIKFKAQAVVITLGDLERLERFSRYLSEGRYAYYRNLVIRNYDQFLQKFLQEIDKETTLLVWFCAAPPEKLVKDKERATPIAFYHADFAKGILYSSSTRKAGIVTLYDVQATLTAFLGVTPSLENNGRKIWRIDGEWDSLQGESRYLISNYQLRWPLLTYLGYLFIFLFIITIISLILRFKWKPFYQGLAYLLLFFASIPATFLIESWLKPANNWLVIISTTLIISGSIFLTAVSLGKKDLMKTYSVIGLLTVILIAVDGFTNGLFGMNSFLSYSVMAGARFYGIGNEYLGFLLGAYIGVLALNWPILKERIPKIKFLLWGGNFGLAVLLVHPSLGANMGGGISAVLGLGLTNYFLLGQKIGWKEIIKLLVATLLLIMAVGIWDYFFSGPEMSHFGRFFYLIKSGDLNGLTEIIYRKWSLNSRLIGYTPLTKFLLGILVIVPIIYRKSPLFVVEFTKKYSFLMKGFLGMTLTALIALLVNDSGIVTVATVFLFGIVLLLLIFINELISKRGVSVSND